MIQLLIDLLEEANGETENIRIAQGKYYLPDNLKDTFKTIKREVQWRKES